MSEVLDKGKLARAVIGELGAMSTKTKNDALESIATELHAHAATIFSKNEEDLLQGKEEGLNDSLLDRLRFDRKRIEAAALGVRQVVALEDPIGEQISETKLASGIRLRKVRVPLGVVGMIYEARPNVTVDAAALCLKTGNAVILRGSASAIHSNKAIVAIIQMALAKAGVRPEAVQLIEDSSRERVTEMMTCNRYLDVIIPRGGADFINHVVRNSSLPCIETGAGNCHIYIDESADPSMAMEIVVNAKTSRPSVCNAAEKIVVHREWAEKNLLMLVSKLRSEKVICKGCPDSVGIVPDLQKASEEDWPKEYLDYVIAIRTVPHIDEAIYHINTYGTRHSEAIVTEDQEMAERFFQYVDAAAVYHNASTRFTDGFEYGFGAEIGISTQKLHARGPMGLRELTSYKYIGIGTGQIRV